MQMAFTDTMAEKSEAEDEEDASTKVSVETLCKYIARLDADEMKSLTSFVEQNNANRSSTKGDTEMTNKLGTDAKANSDRIFTDEGFKKSVREAADTAAKATSRRIIAEDKLADIVRSQDGLASRFPNAARIQIDHGFIQSIPIKEFEK